MSSLHLSPDDIDAGHSVTFVDIEWTSPSGNTEIVDEVIVFSPGQAPPGFFLPVDLDAKQSTLTLEGGTEYRYSALPAVYDRAVGTVAVAVAARPIDNRSGVKDLHVTGVRYELDGRIYTVSVDHWHTFSDGPARELPMCDGF